MKWTAAAGLLTPAALLGDPASALDASLVKAFLTLQSDSLLEAPLEARGAAATAATAFLRVLAPLVRKGLIAGWGRASQQSVIGDLNGYISPR